MAKLTFADLGKPFPSRHPDAGKLRYTKVVSKIANGEPFEMEVGGKKVLEYATPQIEKSFLKGDIATLKGNQRLFKESGKNNIIRLDAIKKSKDFGGGGGSGAGADVTKLAESAQCLYCALVWYVYRQPIKAGQLITPDDLKKAAKYIDTDEKLDKMITDLPDDWIMSSILGANKLYEKYKGARKNFIFHRGSKTVDRIENTFKGINRKERAFGDLNKWSPADIYIVSPKADIKSIEEQETLKGLNTEMLQQYNSKDLIGVSLKKIINSAKFSEINVGKHKGAHTDIKYWDKTIVANERAKIYDSMDVYVQYGQSPKERIQLRSFGSGDGLTGWQGELKGETANQGKVSLGPISYIVKQHTNVTLPSSADVASRVRQRDDKLLEEIHTMAKNFRVPNLPELSTHMKLASTKEPKWKYSKYLGLLLLTVIEKQQKRTRDLIIQDIYSYAGSKSSFSAPYAKVEG